MISCSELPNAQDESSKNSRADTEVKVGPSNHDVTSSRLSIPSSDGENEGEDCNVEVVLDTSSQNQHSIS